MRAHAEGPARYAVQHRAPRRPQPDAARPARHPARQDPRLRLGLLRRHGRRAPDRDADARPGRRRAGVRVPLPQPGDRDARRSTSRSASRARPPTRWPPCTRCSARAGACSASSTSSAARSRASATAASTCTPGPRSSVASTKAFTCTLVAFALLALHLGRIRDLSPARGQAARRRRSQQLPEQIARDPRAAPTPIARRRRKLRARTQRLLHRPRQRLPGRARGRAEAEGDLLHPRRGVPGVGAEARTAGADLARRRRRSWSCRATTCTRRTLSSIEEIRARRGPVIARDARRRRAPAGEGRRRARRPADRARARTRSC